MRSAAFLRSSDFIGDPGPGEYGPRYRTCPRPWQGKEPELRSTRRCASVSDLKNGKAIRVRTYLDPAEALEAAGLSEYRFGRKAGLLASAAAGVVACLGLTDPRLVRRRRRDGTESSIAKPGSALSRRCPTDRRDHRRDAPSRRDGDRTSASVAWSWCCGEPAFASARLWP